MESRFAGTSSWSWTVIPYVSSRNATSSSTPVESTIPWSRNESSPDRPSTGPNGKLSETNLRNCCSMVCMREGLLSTSQEPFDQELGRQDADQRHVVLHADRPTLAELVHELPHGAGVEYSVLPDPPRREQLVDVLR